MWLGLLLSLVKNLCRIDQSVDNYEVRSTLQTAPIAYIHP